MRSFITIELEPQIKNYLGEIQQKTRQYCRRGSYTPTENLQIILYFLGDIEGSDVGYIEEAIFATSRKNKSFSLCLDEIGFFPKGKSGVLWAGIEKSIPLEKLFFDLSKNLNKQGFGKDKTGLTSHITLGREVEPQRKFIDVQKSVPMEHKEFLVDRITLVESKRRGNQLFNRTLCQQILK